MSIAKGIYNRPNVKLKTIPDFGYNLNNCGLTNHFHIDYQLGLECRYNPAIGIPCSFLKTIWI